MSNSKRTAEPQELCNSEPLPQSLVGMQRRYERDLAIRARKESCYEACAGIEDPAKAITDVRQLLKAWRRDMECPEDRAEIDNCLDALGGK